MNWADYALLTILLVSMGIGVWRGFIVEVLSLTVWIGAFWMTIGFGADVADGLTGIESPSARQFVGHTGVFLVVLLGGGLAVWGIGRMIASTGLSATDRVLGIGFGLVRGLVLVCVSVLLLGFTPMPQEGWWSSSKLLPSAQRGADWMITFLPPETVQQLDFSVDGRPLLPMPAGGALPAGDDAAPAAGETRPPEVAVEAADPAPEN